MSEPTFELDRRDAVPALIGNHEDFLIVSGLAGASKDLAALTADGAHLFTMAGAMGAACMAGLGLALARPERRVLVATGDGELLMNLGSLAAIGVRNPPNLSILCIDNGHYGETGYQLSHTSQGVDLAAIATGAGIRATRVVERAADLAPASELLRTGNTTSFVLLRVAPTDPAAYKRNLDPASCRARFRANLGL